MGHFMTSKLLLLFVLLTGVAEAQFITSIVSTPSGMTATITWTTCAAGTSRVRYGTTNKYGLLAVLSPSVTSHSVTLTGLKENTVYHFQVGSTDASNELVTGTDHTFTTTGTQTHSVSLMWTAAATNPPGHSVSFAVYKATGACPQNTSARIAQNLASASFKDSGTLVNGTSYCYMVSETDTVNGVESGKSTGYTAVIP